jgi:hypothetical protein
MKEPGPTVNQGREPADRRPDVAADLVEYFVVVFPDPAALGSVIPPITEMARAAQIRLLDVAVLVRDVDGTLDIREVDDVEHVEALGSLDGDLGLLSENDLVLAGQAVHPGEAALVLVVEDRWAEQLSVAVRRAGGQIAAGERMPWARVDAALAEGIEDDPGG